MVVDLPFITYTKYIRELDDSLIISFRAFDQESQRKLYNYTLNAVDKAHFIYAVRKNEPVLFKIERYSVNLLNNEIKFDFPAGSIHVLLTDQLLDVLKQLRSANIYVMANDFKIVKTKKGVKIYANQLSIKIADLNIEYAKELLKEYDPLTLIAYSLGYKPEKEIIALTIPRILPIFKPYNLGVHIIQFTPPETGKTSTIRILTQLVNAYHCLSFPSRAKLVGDARFNTYGLAYKYDVIFVEEFDKISGNRAVEFREDYETLLTGLEQGVWQREKSSRSDIYYTNPVSFYLSGNVANKDLDEYNINAFTATNRDRIKFILEQKLDVNLEPLISRFCYVEYIKEQIRAMRYLNYDENKRVQYLDPRVSRGLFFILVENQDRTKYKNEHSRMDRHFNTLKAITKTLKLELDDNTIEKLTRGETTFLEVLKQEKSESAPKSEQNQPKPDQELEEGEDFTFDLSNLLQ